MCFYVKIIFSFLRSRHRHLFLLMVRSSILFINGIIGYPVLILHGQSTFPLIKKKQVPVALGIRYFMLTCIQIDSNKIIYVYSSWFIVYNFDHEIYDFGRIHLNCCLNCCQTLLNYLTFHLFDCAPTRWRFIPETRLRTKFNIYVFIVVPFYYLGFPHFQVQYKRITRLLSVPS